MTGTWQVRAAVLAEQLQCECLVEWGEGFLGSCAVTPARGVGLGQHYPTKVLGSCATSPPSPSFSVESCHWHTQVPHHGASSMQQHWLS